VVDLPALEAGAPAPEFAAATVDGEPVSLASLLSPGRPLALVFADTHCSACAGALEAAAAGEREGSANVAVIMRGDGDKARERARALGLHRVVHDADDAVFEAFRVHGAPGTLLVDAEGRVAAPVAMGADGAREAIAAAATQDPVVIVQAGSR
jgi:peroxiredoxin